MTLYSRALWYLIKLWFIKYKTIWNRTIIQRKNVLLLMSWSVTFYIPKMSETYCLLEKSGFFRHKNANYFVSSLVSLSRLTELKEFEEVLVFYAPKVFMGECSGSFCLRIQILFILLITQQLVCFCLKIYDLWHEISVH